MEVNGALDASTNGPETGSVWLHRRLQAVEKAVLRKCLAGINRLPLAMGGGWKRLAGLAFTTKRGLLPLPGQAWRWVSLGVRRS